MSRATSCPAAAGRLLAVVVISATAGAAQATTSPLLTMLQNESSDGRRTASTNYVLDGAFGVGVTARRSSSPVFVLTGGFTSTLDVPATGSPWLTATAPRFTTLRQQAALRLTGTDLHVGSGARLRVGTTAVPITNRGPDAVAATLPVLPAPGWLPVELATSTGTTTLPRGLGVLPLLEADPTPTSGKAFELVFRGTQGDHVLWALGIGQSPPVVVPGVHFGFALTPPAFLAFAGLSIRAADGVLRLPMPAQPYPVGQLYLQALFLSNHPGYAPGSFSNVLRL